MPLPIGTRLGPYEVVAAVGAGGMGEVYRARDTRLNRDVAIKVLPEGFAADANRRARFEREAQAIAALSHPNILAIHDTGIHDGQLFVVTELLEGETLRERLSGGGTPRIKGSPREESESSSAAARASGGGFPRAAGNAGGLPVKNAIDIAVQIARGLGAAHDKHLVHRDLKPENVFLLTDGQVKILDFGLARPIATGTGATETVAAGTEPGVVMGTVGYMAPEQVRGRGVDARTDLFALGAVLYEMLSGHRAFWRETPAETMTAILREDPPELTQARPDLPPALDRIVRHSLEKNPAERFQSARDVAFALEALSGSGSAASLVVSTDVRTRRRVLPVAAACLMLGALGGAWLIQRAGSPAAAPPSVMRFTIVAPEHVSILFAGVAVSPDGRSILFSALPPGKRPQIWRRTLDDAEPHPLPGTEYGMGPFWSHDGSSIGFFSLDGKLKTTSANGGPVDVFCDAPGTEGIGGTWNQDGIILFSTSATGGLQRISINGGAPAAVTQPDTAHGETAQLWPQFLPDGRHFLYTAVTIGPDGSDERWAVVGSLDASLPKPLKLRVDSYIAYAANGYVVFVRQGTLMVQPFNAATLSLEGEATPLAAGLRNQNAGFAVSRDSVVYLTASRATSLAWFDRFGKMIPAIATPGDYGWPALSPVDRRIAIDRIDPSTGKRAVWVLDDRGAEDKRTSGAADDSDAVWSVDGHRLAFAHDVGRALQEVAVGGASSVRTLLPRGEPNQVYPSDWSADNRIAYTGFSPSTIGDIWLLTADGASKPVPLAVTSAHEHQARFSPDGHWVAYASDETGRPEVYVKAAPPGQFRAPVSAGGGAQPMWANNGSELELFYLAPDNTLTVVPMQLGAEVRPSQPRKLFKLTIDESNFYNVRNHYSVTSDGQRFFVNSVTGAQALQVVLNWSALLKK